MDDELAASAGIPPVTLEDSKRSDAEDYKDLVQGAVLKRIHERGFYTISRIELRAEGDGMSARIFGYAAKHLDADAVGSVSGRTPSELAEAVYSWMDR